MSSRNDRENVLFKLVKENTVIWNTMLVSMVIQLQNIIFKNFDVFWLFKSHHIAMVGLNSWQSS